MAEVKTPPKRLVDLHPEWVMNTTGEVYGIAYDCPCGVAGFDSTNGVSYEQCCPRGGREVVPTKGNFLNLPSCADSLARGWDIAGDSFENVSLSPSVHAVGHWHGFIRNGMVESC